MMGLKIKTFRQISASMIDWVTSNSSKLTNFYVGSVARTMLEAVAIEIESVYFQMYRGFKGAIENSIFASFDFVRVPALASFGDVVFIFREALPNSMIIPKGYRIATVPINSQVVYFEVKEATQVLRGSVSAVVPVVCTTPGPVGNVPANVINLPLVRMSEVESITNPQPFYNGAAEEAREDRKKRFNQYINNLSRGTISSVQYGCLRVPGVAGAYVDEGIGYITIHLHDSAGNLTEEMKEQVHQSLLDYRAAGIEATLLPVSKRTVNINVDVVLAKGFDPVAYKQAISTSISNYVNSYVVSKSLIRADLIRHIMSIDENAIVNTSVNMTEDVIINKYDLIRAGTVVVNILT